MENKLRVNDLTISFRTTNGKVQAVRGISFDLNKGETLSIVGESGSGKSVTCKAVLGILAGNSIVEGGEIIYDGKDLLKISEEDFHKIRGDKIAMIFQDPMSSLNPIVKIGRQLTEAMILKGRARQKESRMNFNAFLKGLCSSMKAAVRAEGKDEDARIDELCNEFAAFEKVHIKLEAEYNSARDAADDAIQSIADIVFEMEKNAVKDMKYRLRQIAMESNAAIHPYLVNDKAESLKALTHGLAEEAESCRESGDFKPVIEKLAALKDILADAVKLEAPDFFAMGHYLASGKEAIPEKRSITALNEFLRDELHRTFMNGFFDYARKGIAHAAGLSYDAKAVAVASLSKELAVFNVDGLLDRKECKEAAKRLERDIKASINPLLIVKDSLALTFSSALCREMETYFSGIDNNAREERRHDRLQRRHDMAIKRGKNPDWQVPAASVTDLELSKRNMRHLISRLISHYEKSLSERNLRDFDRETLDFIEHLKENASGIISKVTKKAARLKAIKLMEEVGIAEPRRRYNQYPFEFSGGMRQRIVIAIALAANPDILICDEPTTALDVTIQSQILELINKLKKERQLSVIFITHDLGVVANMADRIAVMYAGKIVEYGTSDDIFYHSAHPYTWALLSSMPDLDTNERLETIPGTPPNMIYPPSGDAFAARNKYAMKIDFERQPPFFKISDTHYAATWLLHPDAPHVDPPKTVIDRIARMQRKREAHDE